MEASNKLYKQALEAAKKAGIDFTKVDFTEEAFVQGYKVELEHDDDPETDVVNDPVQVAKIAWRHLKESPKYYDALENMEKQFGESEMKLRPVLREARQRNMPKGVKPRSGKSRPYFDQSDQGPQWGGGSDWRGESGDEMKRNYHELKMAGDLTWYEGGDDLIDAETGEVHWDNGNKSQMKKNFGTNNLNQFKKILKQYKIKTR